MLKKTITNANKGTNFKFFREFLSDNLFTPIASFNIFIVPPYIFSGVSIPNKVSIFDMQTLVAYTNNALECFSSSSELTM